MPPRKAKAAVAVTDSLFDNLHVLANKTIGDKDDPNVYHWLSSGITLLDCALGNGIPGGKLTVVRGPYQKGKTLLALAMCRSAQQLGGQAIWLDAEARFSSKLRELCGVSTDKDQWFFRIPNNLEMTLDFLEKVAEKALALETPTVIVLDSVAAIGSKAIGKEERDIDEKGYRAPLKAAKLAEFFERGILRDIAGSNVFLVFTNQIRDSLDFHSYGPKQHSSPGGHAVDHNVTVMLKMGMKQLEKEGPDGKKRTIGNWLNVTVEKNAGPCYRTVSFPFYYRAGLDNNLSILNYLIAHGAMKKVRNIFYKLDEVEKTKAEWREAMTEDPELLESMKVLLRQTYLEVEG